MLNWFLFSVYLWETMYPEDVQGVATYQAVSLWNFPSASVRWNWIPPYLCGSSFGGLEVTEDMYDKFPLLPWKNKERTTTTGQASISNGDCEAATKTTGWLSGWQMSLLLWKALRRLNPEVGEELSQARGRHLLPSSWAFLFGSEGG